MHDQLRLAAIRDVENDHAGVTPGRIGRIATNDRVMEAVASMRRPGRRLGGAAVHTGNPVAAGFARMARVRHVDDEKNVITETVEQRRDVSPAPADVPDPMHAPALDRHEADLPRRVRLRY